MSFKIALHFISVICLNIRFLKSILGLERTLKFDCYPQLEYIFYCDREEGRRKEPNQTKPNLAQRKY